MRRVFVPRIEGDTVSISDESHVHHLKDVLRLSLGDEIVLFDDSGYEYMASIASIGRNEVSLSIKSKQRAETRTLNLSIACAIPKHSRMDDIIDKLTQLGIDRIIPMETEHVVVRLSDSQKLERLSRWRKIAQSAAEQSQRHVLPVIEPITGLAQVIAQSIVYDLKLMPTLPGTKPLKEALSSKKSNIMVLIGPEGDFSPVEIKMAKEHGFELISLGDNVLRVDTAAIAVASFIELCLSD